MYGNLSTKFGEILSSLSSSDREVLMEVYTFSHHAHLDQKRKSGEDYFIHPLAVAINLHNKFGDLELTCAGLLHDTVEDNETIHMNEIYNRFGYEVGYLVDSVTKNKQQYYGEDQIYERKIDKFLFGGIKSVKCYLLKLADRDDNMKTIGNLKDFKQVRIAFETQAIFTPLENILDYHNLSSIQEAEDNLKTFCKNNNITDYLELKDKLISSTYQNFSSDSFDSVYQNSNNVTWKITNREILDDFLQIPEIDDKIEMISINYGNISKFSYMFRFKKGEIMKSNIKLQIGDTYSF
ncbi:MAG: bifunctional (p)ppGpp synthetase/guanosine-3',5'-bis(diphosphate) 3'-pyrophosphohydrolase [Candidatus Gracilibacteria bacterium]|nr:bifunctional (p)ppGpp synthetase/guanosine-3',5'-bis(diphosphate) 3'-pyrophosphohydrolase [Candidatus Gracilibacteria bacterium]